ncbi:MAG: hypothetical protein J5858_04735, partial [Lentisphaeria bacterium]|nr:hypothetical protein [Lentisphaeria bacterium]
MRRKISLTLLGIFSVLMLIAGERKQDSWDIFNMPGDYENPGVIKVIPGEVQSLIFYFMTPKSVLSAQTVGSVLPKGEVLVSQETRIIAKDRHRMIADMTFPAGMEWLDSGMGVQPVEKKSHKYQVMGRRIVDSFICDKAMLQPQGPRSEWKTYKIAVRVSENAPIGEEIFTLSVSHEGKPVVKKSWKIERVAKF